MVREEPFVEQAAHACGFRADLGGPEEELSTQPEELEAAAGASAQGGLRWHFMVADWQESGGWSETTSKRIPSSAERVQVDVPKSAGRFATVIEPSACKGQVGSCWRLR